MGMLEELFTQKYAAGDVVTDGIKGKKKNRNTAGNKTEGESKKVNTKQDSESDAT